MDEVTVIVLHFAPVPPPMYAGRPAAVPVAAASNDAANDPAFLASYCEIAARQLPDPRHLVIREAHSGLLGAASLESKTPLRVAIGTPEIEEGSCQRASSPPHPQSPAERERTVQTSEADSRESIQLDRCEEITSAPRPYPTTTAEVPAHRRIDERGHPYSKNPSPDIVDIRASMECPPAALRVPRADLSA